MDVTRHEGAELTPEEHIERLNVLLEEPGPEPENPTVEPMEPMKPSEGREGPEASEAPTGYSEQQAELLRADINRIAEVAHELAGRPETVAALVRDLDLDVPYLVARVHDLLYGDEVTRRHAAADMMVKLQVMQALAQRRMDELGSSAGGSDRGKQDAGSRESGAERQLARSGFRRLLDEIFSTRLRLWKLIAGLVTPKEWTLSGEVEVPFFVKAGIEIKFGPQVTRLSRARSPPPHVP